MSCDSALLILAAVPRILRRNQLAGATSTTIGRRTLQRTMLLLLFGVPRTTYAAKTMPWLLQQAHLPITNVWSFRKRFCFGAFGARSRQYCSSRSWFFYEAAVQCTAVGVSVGVYVNISLLPLLHLLLHTKEKIVMS